MFAKLTERLGKAVEALRGRGRLTEENIAESLREVRMALLEADVALPVVKRFIDAVKAKAVGAEVVGSLTPGQALIGVIHDELVAIMGGKAQPFDLRHAPPAVILLAGLQGAGKTTTAGKLARLLIGQKKRVLLVSTDIRRPAAVLQLQRLAEQVGANFHPVEPGAAPAKIATSALDAARRGVFDVLIVDTAGRLHIDAELMQEVRDIDQAVSPHERLFVVDAMAGQDAVNAAKAFGEALQLTGTILTKADGDARGGAALSVREITGSPLLFIGMGEKSDALEPFDPDRMARRILGMGDVVALVEEVRRSVDVEEAQKLAQKVAKGKGFDFNDLKSQLQQLQKMGGMAGILDKLPGGAAAAKKLAPGVAEKELKRQIALIDSMTPRERRRPEIIDGSRRRRIAAGSGMQVQDVNRLLKQHLEMQRMMKKLGGGKLARMMGAMAGKMPGMPR
ncbi:MAG: signal recognition particle protein [Proteobacteria bacterium]|jgi:signal recognition particle subunit SRP54|nr:signal recognition particle protein [Pseudomonadota bacterium]MBK9252955.1 signal recognition particle protein [Pseudomonadota bacterium]